MTTIAYRDGILAADSIATLHTEAGGTRLSKCSKLYERQVFNKDTNSTERVLFATAGDTFPSLMFIDWYCDDKDHTPDRLIGSSADFTVLVLDNEGLFEYDSWCFPEKIEAEFYAIGSGANAALGAMYMGATAEQAVRIACEIDPYSRPPIKTLTLLAL